jgi:antitoxin YefM
MTMQSSFRLNARDLDQHFLESLKTLFQDKEIEIIVYDVDETAYLSQSEANRQRLIQAIKNVENGTNLVEVNLEELE